MQNHYFITIDAENDLISDGIEFISEIRVNFENEAGIKIPLIWFIRFQRSWEEYVDFDSASYFTGPVKKTFDGFELAKPFLLKLFARGDELGWHYHAYNYVHRDDLDHKVKMDILKNDLIACAEELNTRHSEFNIKSFRFGWFFIPDYEIYKTLKLIGITIDASVNPEKDGQNVAIFKTRFVPSITKSLKEIDDIYFFPYIRTLLIHDWNVIPHSFDWSTLDRHETMRNRYKFKENILTRAVELKKSNSQFLTYQSFLKKLDN